MTDIRQGNPINVNTSATMTYSIGSNHERSHISVKYLTDDNDLSSRDSITIGRGSLNLPGPSDESRRVVEELLNRDHNEHDILFNDSGFHNHLSHHLLANLSLGSPPPRLREIFKQHTELLPMPPRRGPITSSTWRDHLGQRERYADYLDFFDSILGSQSINHVVEKYIFDPEILPRFVSGVFHPLIHIGNGIEFSSTNVIAQGLAEACISRATMRGVIVEEEDNELVDSWEKLDTEGRKMGKENKGKPIADLLEMLRIERELDGLVSWGEDDRIVKVVEKAGEKIKKVVKDWGCSKNNLDQKLEDLYTSCVFIYGATTRPNHAPKADFFFMHALTSAYFLPNYLSTLRSPSNCVTLLNAHLSATLSYYVAQGRPNLYIPNLLSYKPQHKRTSNPWTVVIDLAISAEEPHVPKVVRALAQGEIKYGWLAAAWNRAAEMSVDVDGNWYFEGVGFDEAWDK